MFLFQKIEELMYQNSETKQTIGNFLLDNRNNLSQYSMEEIARLTFTSKSTLVRFAKSLGYSGWKEFMYAFSHEVVSLKYSDYVDTDSNFPFGEDDKPIQVIEKISNLQIQSIQDTVSLIDIDKLNQAAEIINQAHRIIIYGTSPNNYYGGLLKRKLLGIGKSAQFSQIGESGVLSQSLTREDCAIMISYTGNNPDREPTTNIKYLVKRNVPIIGITSGGDNYLSRYSKVVLNISSKERLYSKISNFATEQSIMLMINLLYSTVFSLEYEENIQKKIMDSMTLELHRQSSSHYLSE